jgi:subtilisin family serine protease
MNPLTMVGLLPLMELTEGRPEVRIGLIDGPVASGNPELASARIRRIAGPVVCTSGSAACTHGTFVAAILSATRESSTRGICPGCTLLVRPIFGEVALARGDSPSATPDELAKAMLECAEAGARILNVSAAVARPSSEGERVLDEALSYIVRRGVIVAVAAGNQGTVGSTILTRHPGLIPVVAYDQQAKPMGYSNFGGTIGRRGVGGPGDRTAGVGPDGQPLTMSGTSVAVPYVSGTIALLWSVFPAATATDIRLAVTGSLVRRRASVVPPLLDAWGAYQAMRR